MTERTLSIIKPDAVERNLIGAIVQMIEATGLEVVAMKMLHLSKKEAEGFPIEFVINADNDMVWENYVKAKIYWHASGYGEDLEKKIQA